MHEGLTHIVKPAEMKAKDFKGEAKYKLFGSIDSPDYLFSLIEDFSRGVAETFSGGGGKDCQHAMSGMIYYIFEMINNREVYNPKKSVKLVIAFQSFQQQQALFYT